MSKLNDFHWDTSKIITRIKEYKIESGDQTGIEHKREQASVVLILWFVCSIKLVKAIPDILA
jgi:hypothetical protein